MTRIAIIQEWVPAYRRDFFEELRLCLRLSGVELDLFYGRPPASKAERGDALTVPWGNWVSNKAISVAGRSLVFQHLPRSVLSADLVVAPLELRLPLTAALPFVPRRLRPQVVFWGRGENFDSDGRRASVERLKRLSIRRCDGAFAYSDRSARLFVAAGLPPDRVLTVGNTLASETADAVVTPVLAALLRQYEGEERPIGWICSALDDSKRLDFLLSCLDSLRERVPNFVFFVVGEGPGRARLELARSQGRAWLHVTGRLTGADKAAVARVAGVAIHPGLLGLNVVDYLRAGSPTITSALGYHSHEFDLLRHGRTMVLLAKEAGADMYAESVTALLSDRPRLRAMSEECRRRAAPLGIARFAATYHDAVLSVLSRADSSIEDRRPKERTRGPHDQISIEGAS